MLALTGLALTGLLMVAFRVTPTISSTLPAMAGIVILPDIWPVNVATFALAEEAVYSAPGVAGFVPDGAVVSGDRHAPATHRVYRHGERQGRPVWPWCRRCPPWAAGHHQ